MEWTDLARKLTSRRLWVAVAGIVTGVALALGGETGEIQSLAGAITAVLSALGYMVTEASVDRARATAENNTSGSTFITNYNAPLDTGDTDE